RRDSLRGASQGRTGGRNPRLVRRRPGIEEPAGPVLVRVPGEDLAPPAPRDVVAQVIVAQRLLDARAQLLAGRERRQMLPFAEQPQDVSLAIHDLVGAAGENLEYPCVGEIARDV